MNNKINGEIIDLDGNGFIKLCRQILRINVKERIRHVKTIFQSMLKYQNNRLKR